MADIEMSSGDYKNKHSRAIHLNYSGVASDLMELNPSVADNFMRVSDMRRNILIVQKPQDRVRDYEDVGFVKVAKFLKMPRLGLWRGDNMMQTRSEEDTWLIAINDQELADKVARDQTAGRKFEDRYVDAFNKEVNRGLLNCLKREKLFNSGKYNLAFAMGYFSLLNYDLSLLPVVVAAGLSGHLNTPVETISIITILTLTEHLFVNGLISLNAVYDDRFGKFGGSMLSSGLNDPFIKHSALEFMMPIVPIDRLIRGSRYLSQHGDEMIRRVAVS